MTYGDRIKACKRYKAKLAMIGKKNLADDLFQITGLGVSINLSKLAEVQEYPETLYIPDFVNKIK